MIAKEFYANLVVGKTILRTKDILRGDIMSINGILFLVILFSLGLVSIIPVGIIWKIVVCIVDVILLVILGYRVLGAFAASSLG